MRVQVDYDAAERVWTVLANEIRLRTADDVGAWARALEAALNASVPAGADLMMNIEGLEIDMTARDAFAHAAQTVARRHGKVLLYGRGAGVTGTVLLLLQLQQSEALQVFADRRETLRALRRVRSLPQERAADGGAVAKG